MKSLSSYILLGVYTVWVISSTIGPIYAKSTGVDISACTKKTFTVSWYYSPSKDQDNFYRGDYQSEVRLNWMGLRGASWKPVFNWMLAGPKSYAFGTKIYFPGYGIGEVADRWQAIVKAGERGYSNDRIDVWMGWWEEGLKRALSFGKQNVVGYICDKSLTPGLNMSAFPVAKDFFLISLWGLSLEKGREDKWVEAMQSYLAGLWYLWKDKITGYFGEETEDALCSFQVNRGLLKKTDDMCGYFGPQTRWELRRVVSSKWVKASQILLTSSVKKTQEKNNTPVIADAKVVTTTVVEKKVETKPVVQGPRLLPQKKYIVDKTDDDIRYLQEYLKKINIFTWEISWIYNDKTIDAVYSFQLQNRVLDESSDYSLRGHLWPKTISTLNDSIVSYTKKQQELEAARILEEQKKAQESVKLQKPITRSFNKGESDPQIWLLQEKLKKLSLYSGSINGIYDDATLESVYQFQLKYKVLTSASDPSLKGFMGPKTREVLNNLSL